MRELSKNIAVMSTDYRQLTDWVARGKYVIGVGMRPDEVIEYMRLGAPIKFVADKEPRILTPGWGYLNVFNNRPHPVATQVFVNWLLTREVLSQLSQISERPATRLDVPTEGVSSQLLPRPGDIMDSESRGAAIPQMQRMAKEDFGTFFK